MGVGGNFMNRSLLFLFIVALAAVGFFSCKSEEDQVSRGLVRITSLPEGAQVVVDGNLSNLTTPTELSIEPGTHEFSLILPDYERWDSVMSVADNGLYELWHRMLPVYPVGPIGNPEETDLIWFIGTYDDPDQRMVVGEHQVYGRVNNVIGDSVQVALLIREHPDSCCWRLLPQPDGSLTVPIVGTGWWQAIVDPSWWSGSLAAWLVPPGTALDANRRYSVIEVLGNDLPTAAAYFPVESFDWFGDPQGVVVGFVGHNWYWYDPFSPSFWLADEAMHFNLNERNNGWWWGAEINLYVPYTQPEPQHYSYGAYQTIIAGPFGDLPVPAHFKVFVSGNDWVDQPWVWVVFDAAAVNGGYFLYTNGVMDTIAVRQFQQALPADTTVCLRFEYQSGLTLAEINALVWLGENAETSIWDSASWSFSVLPPIANFGYSLVGGPLEPPLPQNPEIVVQSFEYYPQ